MRARSSILAVVLLAGCYRSTEPGDGGVDAGESIGDRVRAYVREQAREMCRRGIECEPDTADEVFRQLECHPNDVDADYYADRVESGAYTFDEDAAAECLRLLRDGTGCFADEVYSACWPFIPSRREGEACSGLYDGRCGADLHCDRSRCACVPSPPLGAPCGENGECVDGAWCQRDSRTCVLLPGPGAPCERRFDCWDDSLYCIDGVCTAEHTFRAGDDCLDFAECGPDLRCALVTDRFVCVEHADLEDECRSSTDCRVGLACADGRCGPLRAAGERCGSDVDCAPDAPYCVGPLGAGVCHADATGVTCLTGYAYSGARSCPEGLACVPEGSLTDRLAAGTCQPRLRLGDACADGRSCPSRSRCVSSRCVYIVMPDEPCGADAVCPRTHACESGRCAPLPDVGEPCDAAHPCYFSSCVDGVCGRAPPGTPCEMGVECSGACSLDTHVCLPTVSEGADCSWEAFCDEGLRCTFGSERPICVAEVCPAAP